MMLAQRSPSEVLDSNVLSVSDYEQAMDFFWQQLIRLNVNIEIIDKVVRFPFGLFVELPRKSTFFLYVRDNFFETSVLAITRLITDGGGNGHYTLPQLKGQVKRAIRPEFELEFRENLKAASFDKRAAILQGKAKELRNKYIAHIDAKVVFGDDEQTDMTLGELKEIRDGINKLYDALSFGGLRGKLFSQYDPIMTRPDGDKSDIEELLDLIAKNSIRLNAPEDQPEFWPYIREGMTENEITLLNHYRSRFGLPSV